MAVHRIGRWIRTRRQRQTAVWTQASQLATSTLTAGTAYRFGVQVSRQAGTTDLGDHRCEVVADITYSDAGSSSLSSGSVAPAAAAAAGTDGR